MNSGATQNSPNCPRCGEELIASAWSEHLSVSEVRDFWHCSKCGNMFETLSSVSEDSTLSPEVIEEFLPTLLVA
jgi:transcription elongation factor Elf1